MKNILIILSHPDMSKSRINRALIQGVQGKKDLIISDLYRKYPDFRIDVAVEQELLKYAEAVIFQYPFYWYHCPRC